MYFIESYKKALAVLMNKPFVLWGLSLMHGLLTTIAFFVFGFIPACLLVVVYLLSVGMAKIFLDGLEEKSVSSEQLFAAFNKNFLRIAGAMAWKDLWIIIWSMVPFAGPIIAVVKSYSYRFVPYIIATNPDVKATEALKLSMELTKGKKGQMFLADICFGAAIGIAFLVLGLLSLIPVLGVLFALVLAILAILVFALSSIFVGLYQAYFFADAKSEN